MTEQSYRIILKLLDAYQKAEKAFDEMRVSTVENIVSQLKMRFIGYCSELPPELTDSASKLDGLFYRLDVCMKHRMNPKAQTTIEEINKILPPFKQGIEALLKQ